MTTIIRSAGPSPTSALAAIDMARARRDREIVKLPGLVAWWWPGFGVTNPGSGTEATGGSMVFRDMINLWEMRPMSDTGPQLIASAHNSQPCLRFNAAGRNGRLYDADGHDLWPGSASVTLAYVAKDAGGSNTAYLGTDKASGYAEIRHASSGAVQVRHVEPTNVLSEIPPSGDTVPHIGIYSYDFSDKTFAYSMNGTTTDTGTAAEEVASPSNKLTIGTAGATGSPTFRGDFHELLVFNVALHRSEYALPLATLKAFLKSVNRYNL